MPAYRCEVLQPDGSTARRVVEAASREDAEGRLREAGDTVLAIADPGPSLAAKVVALRPWRGSPPVQGRGWGWGLSAGAAFAERPHPNPSPEGEGLRFALAALLLSIPFTTGLIATALTIRETTATAQLRQQAPPRLERTAMMYAAVAARPAVAAALGGPSISTLLGRIAGALPAGATLASVARAGDGTLRLEVETGDPEALRAAFAGDPLLGRLRTTGETVVPDRGVRVQLAGAIR